MYYDKFKKRFEQEAVLRNLSERTRKSYWWHIADYGNFCNKDPEQTCTDELRAYFQTMLTDGNHKPGSVKMGYYHLVFTLPHELNPLCLQNKKAMYSLLFKAASQTSEYDYLLPFFRAQLCLNS